MFIARGEVEKQWKKNLPVSEQKAPSALQFLPVMAPALRPLCPGFPPPERSPCLNQGVAAPSPAAFPGALRWLLPAVRPEARRSGGSAPLPLSPQRLGRG